MTRNQALQIARNFLRQWRDIEPEKIYIKRQDASGGPITIIAVVTDDEGDEHNYEVEMEPLYNTIIAKEVLATVTLADYMAEPRMLSTLKPGECFRLMADSVVYEYHRPIDMFGVMFHSFYIKNSTTRFQREDTTVYPLTNT